MAALTCGTCDGMCDCFGSVASAMAMVRMEINAPTTASNTINVLPEVTKHRGIMVENRRYLHQHPELSYQEVDTAKYLQVQIDNIIQEYNTTHATSLPVTMVQQVDGTHGMWVDVSFGTSSTNYNASPTILLRADMDALPIQETGTLSYKSQNKGCMHACGHDAHMAILVAALRVLVLEEDATLCGKIRFMFQPAEEGGAGALRMIKGGCLDGVDRVFGLHIWNFMDAHTVGIAPGPITAFSDRIYIDIVGAGGHGSMPQGTVDAVLVAAHLVVALHSGVVSRSVDPFEAVALTVGKIVGGEVANAIAGTARLEGTVRTRNKDTKKIVVQRIEEICRGVGVMFGATVSLNYKDGYPATISSEEGAKDVAAAATRVVGKANVVAPHPTLAGEDMSYYLEKRDGAFFFVGSAKKGCSIVPHHRADFDIDEQCLDVGASVMVQLVRDLCGGGGGGGGDGQVGLSPK